jgi:N-acetylmuramoyl-L-alanine amidase/Putative peptidoglycan binding domain
VARCPFANWNPVNFTAGLARMTSPPKAVFLHTNGGGPHLTSWFDQLFQTTHQHLGSTFQVFTDGSIDQLCDTESVIYAQYDASKWAVSIETEDDGDAHTPWTPAQLAAIEKLLNWLHQEHGIPLQAAVGPSDAGISYHQQFAIYNKAGHDCPGPVRVNQLLHRVIPRLTAAGNSPAVGHGGNGGAGTHGHVPKPLHELPLPWMTEDQDTRIWQAQMLARGWSRIGTPDGVYGQKSKAVCEAFQREKGATVSGEVDAHTWALAWTAPITH